jgi:hypothetical protein
MLLNRQKCTYAFLQKAVLMLYDEACTTFLLLFFIQLVKEVMSKRSVLRILVFSAALG